MQPSRVLREAHARQADADALVEFVELLQAALEHPEVRQLVRDALAVDDQPAAEPPPARARPSPPGRSLPHRRRGGTRG